MPEGDSLHRAARRLQPLVGETVTAESPHPRGAATGVAEQIDGRTLEGVEAVGKNLFLTFSGGVVLRSHLRMTGRWTVRPAASEVRGRPWLVLRGRRYTALQWGGPVLELNRRVARRLGPDILDRPPDLARMAASIRAQGGRAIGDALLDQRLVSGIGNLWKAESLWAARVSPWRPVSDLTDEELHATLSEAARLMRRSVDTGREERAIYGAAGRPCPRCKTAVRSWGQGDDNRTAYWCPECQPGPEPKRGLYARSA